MWINDCPIIRSVSVCATLLQPIEHNLALLQPSVCPFLNNLVPPTSGQTSCTDTGVLTEHTNTEMHQNFQLVRRMNNYCLACERERATAASFLALRTLRELHSFHRLRSHDKLNGFFRIKWKIFESTQQIPGLERSRRLCF